LYLGFNSDLILLVRWLRWYDEHRSEEFYVRFCTMCVQHTQSAVASVLTSAHHVSSLIHLLIDDPDDDDPDDDDPDDPFIDDSFTTSGNSHGKFVPKLVSAAKS
jgi:hypothetical protein